MLGTLMTGNVWFVIMPSQRELIAATMEGREQDPAIGYQAKQRSVHNNYFTFPLLFIMLSGHFPRPSATRNWLILPGARARQRRHPPPDEHPVHVPGVAGSPRSPCSSPPSCHVLVVISDRDILGSSLPANHPGPFGEVADIIHKRCTTCHSSTPTDNVYRSPPTASCSTPPTRSFAKPRHPAARRHPPQHAPRQHHRHHPRRARRPRRLDRAGRRPAEANP
jgi:hypothetical protein